MKAQPAPVLRDADRDSKTSERLAYMSGIVVAEVSIRRMALAVLAVLILAGCGGPRQINPGAAVPATFTTRAHLARLTGADPAAQAIRGAYDRESKAVWLADDLGRVALLEAWTAEFCHLADDVGSADAAAALLTGPTFRPVCGDAPAERRAAAAAAIESARAKP